MKKRRLTVTVPLPPSVNKIYVYNKYNHQKVYKKETKDYLEQVSWDLKSWKNRVNARQITDFKHIDYYFHLGNKLSDAHNFFKILADVFEWAGIVSNDKFLMTRIQSVDYDKENPRVEISWDD